MSANGASAEVPADANENCPGTNDDNAGKAAACEGCPNQSVCATAPKGPDPDLQAIADRMATISHKVLVLSGKGGVGKSTVASQLALSLARDGHDVGLLDIDICGPSLPKMMGLEGEEVHQSGSGWSPVYVEDNLGVMSIGFMLSNPDDAVIWRGPRKNSLIKSFMKDVNWGTIDYLIIDAPPGTSDEHISIAQYLTASGVDGAVMVSTPQEVSIIDVRKEVNFCRKVGVPILGLVENMSGLNEPAKAVKFVDGSGKIDVDVTEKVLKALEGVVPDVGNLFVRSEVYHAGKGGVEKMAKDMNVPFFGRIPLDPLMSKASEGGESIMDCAPECCSAKAFQGIVGKVVESIKGKANGGG
ncbi:hypothetical protein BSKO_01279 [Bryopsis sp. KO-2023]|nr:hypothetical protein BSKO_01279 [Bryopsis sp. KO-2023]